MARSGEQLCEYLVLLDTHAEPEELARNGEQLGEWLVQNAWLGLQATIPCPWLLWIGQ
jgi:hypothetical protein